ncbi:ABC transporter substrate-binding protein [Haladaptatus pallidirubidus]|uniref:ABC transporter substrate-binding protein n=1 Tax=Haladaptatus pallidirubidus TaxID=1008152 RepID=A0AAV3UNT0_9EURY|nr:ABC transporter substrate-binding protein [Haladaptatus pallidirubidus]
MADTTRQSRRSYIKATTATGAVTFGGLAGCLESIGNGGGGQGGSDSIVIAATIPESGQFSSLGQDLKRGYNLGVKQMNEQVDQEVKLILKDDKSDPVEVRKQLQQITSNNDVTMIWGSFSSLLVTAGSAYAENQNVPFLGAFFAYEQPHRNEGYEWTFSPFPKSRDVARSTKGILGLIPENERPTKVGIWEPNSGWGNEQSNAWEETLTEEGYEVVLRNKFEIGAKDFSTLISQSKSNGVEILLSVPTPPGGITAVKQMRDNGWSPKVLKFVRGADPSAWWSSLGKDGAYALMCPGWVPGLTGNGNEELWNSYSDAHNLGENELIPVAVGGSYNVAQVASQAVQAASSTSPKDIQRALRQETFKTVIGNFSFEKNGLPTEGELTAPTGQWWKGGQRLAYPKADSERAIDFKRPIPAWNQR